MLSLQEYKGCWGRSNWWMHDLNLQERHSMLVAKGEIKMIWLQKEQKVKSVDSLAALRVFSQERKSSWTCSNSGARKFKGELHSGHIVLHLYLKNESKHWWQNQWEHLSLIISIWSSKHIKQYEFTLGTGIFSFSIQKFLIFAWNLMASLKLMFSELILPKIKELDFAVMEEFKG